MKFNHLLRILLMASFIFNCSDSVAQQNNKNSTRFSVIDVISSNTKNNTLQLLSRFQLSLSSTAYEAIDHGVPIDIVIEYAKPLDRLWGTQYKELDKSLFRLTRHTLSNNYLLENISAVETNQFITIDEALKHIATFQINQIRLNDSQQIAIRIYLDIFKLPAQIRASAFFSGRWKHDSDWTIWDVS